MLVYGTLFPLSHWQAPATSPFHLMMQKGLANASRSDILTNLLIYLPLGALLMHSLPARLHPAGKILMVTLSSALLSLVLEYFQAYLPGRVPSAGDWLLNTCGGCAGALLSLTLLANTAPGARLNRIRDRYFYPGPLTNLGLLTLGFWALSQLSPMVPSLDLGNLRQGLKPLWFTLQRSSSFEWIRLAEYSLGIAALGLISSTLWRVRYFALVHFSGFACLVLLLKIPVVGRQISLESILGLIAGLGVTALLQRSPYRLKLPLAVIALCGAVIAAGVYAPNAANTVAMHLYAFNWVPFRSHLTNDIIGIIDILGSVWPFLALSYIALLATRTHRLLVALSGAFAIFFMLFALEWYQRLIPGRSADITDAIIAAIAWLAPWLYRPLATKTGAADAVASTPPGELGIIRPRYLLMPVVLLLAFSLAGLAWQLSRETPEQALDESLLPRLPAPDDLPTVRLPGFRISHPRLPSPGPLDIARLQNENPRYLALQKKRANTGKGNFDSAIFMAYVEPGSISLDILHRRLMELEINWRGHEQAKPVAIAYDWLYEQWSEKQRAQLRDKLVHNANYLIQRIRDKERLSPYNVYLYNSPLQALMATTLALYGDDPRGEPVMNYMHDYWKKRVLPVWRQVMGKHGGWHEGGEYVGIGIGQAVYQLPAMWRKATGEDLFRSEPGIRGFLDFLVYRTRPDGTQFRWGDGAHFDRRVPDRIPLAMEYRDAAAYSLNGCPRRVVPSSWPWGPLPDDSLCDPDAVSRLPLARYFDGIGMLIARSDWSPDATYVSFKAGDNYWSHSHLDQGSFTLYRDGALAIDSGAYGGGNGYGSDHHMNYAYQTIAHNTITVHDPDDTLPAPRKDGTFRQIANDGGQRRIGSGWGIEAAPLDLDEWRQKYETYHTGSMQKVFLGDDLAVAVADLTPAYTNEQSGQGTFSNRTRRVEHFNRTFGFDLKSSAVVIFDRVSATRPEFRKRWLQHSLEKPHMTDFGYRIETAGDSRDGGRGVSRLNAHVLLPRTHDITLVGGPGREFYVDGTNYDEDGKTIEKIETRRKTVEAGRWRVELSPATSQSEDVFLVVLLPETNLDSEVQSQVRLVEEDARIGCEIITGQRTTTWWFDQVSEGAVVEVRSGDGRREVHDLRVTQ
jgi:VanZ family protein